MDTIELKNAATFKKVVSGATHEFYRYPARFSPIFAATAIRILSKPGDLIVDPYMGGGTTVIEALLLGRKAIGVDLNPLAVFIANVKTTILSINEEVEIAKWIQNLDEQIKYNIPFTEIEKFVDVLKTKNLEILSARYIKKAIAVSLSSIEKLKSQKCIQFAKCIVLKTSQWALDGKETQTSLDEFRAKMKLNSREMIISLRNFGANVRRNRFVGRKLRIYECNSEFIETLSPFANGEKAKLIVTSPPYPGVHVLYHRWQVDGRKETPAPYWITGCNDGHGASYYSFGDRHELSQDNYFRSSLKSLKSIRKIICAGGYMVQMIAFSDISKQLPRYLNNMREADFREVKIPIGKDGRIWREVPNRKWYTALQKSNAKSREVVLLHRAI